jgi:hypothetical protein
MMRAAVFTRARPMTLLIKMIAAFCVGAAMLAGLQTFGMLQLQRYLKSEQAKAGVPRVGPGIDWEAIKARGPIGPIAPTYGRIDTREGERLGVMSAARRVDLQNRAAQNAVPLPPRHVRGVPRW